MGKIMADNVLEKCAEILVECAYRGATSVSNNKNSLRVDFDYGYLDVNPFSDTLEGRRQADAIEDYLWDKQEDLWDSSYFEVKWSVGGRKMRLDRIKRCLQELIK